MEERDRGLVKKVGWAYNVQKVLPSDLLTIDQYKKLEDEGFGMLADKNNPEKVDESDSVVCPDGSVLTHEQIQNYVDDKYKQNGSVYSSKDSDIWKIQKAQMYYLGFKS
jgi:hypothetical protein